MTVMGAVAQEYFDKNKDNSESVVFLYTDGDDLDEQLMGFLKIAEPFPKLFLVDIPNGVKYINEGDIDVAAFMKKFEAGKLTSKKLQE